MLDLDFPSEPLTKAELTLKHDVRGFLSESKFVDGEEIAFGLGSGANKEFSLELGTRGWVGMTLPVEYGGAGGTAVERMVVTEELLAAGAPVGYHWVADRQSGPSIAVHGSELQKRTFLPGIARGELSFAIGMSEPEAGSDLAAVKTAARQREDGSWVVNGSKIWTSNAAGATHILALFRTSKEKHGGLTQFIVDTTLPGIEVRPIRFIDGSTGFYEVFFTDVIVDDSMRLGDVGAGWGQNRSELALERGGIDRWFSMIGLIGAWSRAGIGSSPVSAERLAQMSVLAWSCRGLSLSIARAVDAGKQPVNEAALVKNYATEFEQLCLDLVHDELFNPGLYDERSDALRAYMRKALMIAPSWTLRGGTNQILRRIVGKAIIRAEY